MSIVRVCVLLFYLAIPYVALLCCVCTNINLKCADYIVISLVVRRKSGDHLVIYHKSGDHSQVWWTHHKRSEVPGKAWWASGRARQPGDTYKVWTGS